MNILMLRDGYMRWNCESQAMRYDLVYLFDA